MIFSLLKIRKKTSAVLAGVLIGAGSLWGLSMWFDIPGQELLSILGSTTLFLFLIILLAIGLITLIKLTGRAFASLSQAQPGDQDGNSGEENPAQKKSDKVKKS